MAIESRVFEHIPETGVTRYFHYDTDTDMVTIESLQDVTVLVESNKALYNSTDERAPWTGDKVLVARIPMGMFWDQVKKGHISKTGAVLDQELFSQELGRFLNDNANSAWRVRPGRI